MCVFLQTIASPVNSRIGHDQKRISAIRNSVVDTITSNSHLITMSKRKRAITTFIDATGSDFIKLYFINEYDDQRDAVKYA